MSSRVFYVTVIGGRRFEGVCLPMGPTFLVVTRGWPSVRALQSTNLHLISSPGFTVDW